MFFSRHALLFAGLTTLSAVAANWDREIVLAPQAGETREDVEIIRWQERARAGEASRDVLGRLGWAYVAKARRTLDAGYFKLAEKTTDLVAAEFGASDESRFLHAYVLHQLHRFHDAEELARTLANTHGAPREFALLSDVLLDEGKLDAAIDALQRFVNASPGAEALCRVAQVRWLKGDIAGATAALEQAVSASSPRNAERHAWLLSRLSLFRLQSGATTAALALADAACAIAADYAPALLARGRALAATGEWARALPPLRTAAELAKLPEYQWWLADVLRANGDEQDARAVEATIVSRGELSDPRTLALFLATRGRDPAKAVRLAREELQARSDVFSHDALAWALFGQGEFTEAQAAMQRALAEHTRDARLFLHAGEIARAAGETEEAQRFFNEARPLAATLLPSERARLERCPGDALHASVFPHHP
jgi:tetratricopeptide (TPR) repeat protein